MSEREEIEALRSELKRANTELSYLKGLADGRQKKIDLLEAERVSWGNEFSAVMILKEEREKFRRLLELVERRCGSASHSSGFTDAQECAQWIRDALKEKT